MQNLIDELIKQFRVERSLSQMTLGKFILKLENLPQERKIVDLFSPHSYRGYYSDLALQMGDGTRSIKSLVEKLKTCLGETFTGYKGGNFYMDEDTPMWIADYGCLGVKIIDINEGEVFSILTKDNN